jgi:hypothetical protein
MIMSVRNGLSLMQMNWSSDPAPDTDLARHEDARTALKSAASQRILIIDGAMGTQIQCLKATMTC